MATAEELKNQGNRYFTNGRYHDAILCYNQAISKNPNVSKYYTNRALTHLRLKKLESCVQDSGRALELDPKCIKAHFFCGQALLDLGNFNEAIISLQKAFNLSQELNVNFGDDIAQTLRIAKGKKWNELEAERVKNEGELEKLLKRLLAQDKEKEIEKIKSKYLHSDVKDKLEHNIIDIQNTYNNYIDETTTIFQKLDDNRRKREVPDHMCGKISFEIMNDPVITPSGITYERKNIEEHLQRVGHFDPITRIPLTSDQLIPNLALKEVIDSYIIENPWVIDY
ncbi:unnamed protein product [Gordionus sp. m RMFG-2023]|uniref:E3 ubiquitin-protein ligase CHIP-like n=1 Tax=Gordionus sp. m RMFG-2023 TaxID=3053472 RepID=UPI0030E16130